MPNKKPELKSIIECLQKLPKGLTYFATSPGTFHYLIQALEAAGNRSKQVEDIDALEKKLPKAVKLVTAHEIPMGVCLALGKNYKFLGVYTVPMESTKCTTNKK